MPPVTSATRASARRLLGIIPAIIHHARYASASPRIKRDQEGGIHSRTDIVFAVLIPVLVLLSGVFAGLTLGYMSLDDTQLHVLSISGTPKQREYANRIKPIRKNGHLLLVTLLLANMIVNETLPIISERVLGGGIQSVVISTVLIIIFAEIIPQSICTRYGLYIGAKMAGVTQFLIYFFGIVSYPVAKLLEFMLGAHHGIIYRRTELKELIAMHSSMATHGGDLKDDTVNIIGATLDLQEKDVKQAMTPIGDVFMLSINAILDYALLRQIVQTGHSRVPIYEEVNIKGVGLCKRIVGIMLVKQLILLDPQSSIPIRKLTLNHVPFIPSNMPLLGILDRFQEGRSHMAIVSRISVEKAASVKIEMKRGLTRRLKDRVGISGDTTSSDEDDSEDKKDSPEKKDKEKRDRGNPGLQLPLVGLEQSMPADAVLTKAGADEFLQGVDPAIMPLGIITLEDVLEELIGEEIYDEFDPDGAHQGGVARYDPLAEKEHHKNSASPVIPSAHLPSGMTTPTESYSPRQNPLNLKNLSFLRPRSTPPQTSQGVTADEKDKDNVESRKKETGDNKKVDGLPEPKTKLEAILLDRQRRAVAPVQAAAIQQPLPRIAVTHPHMKGGKFKSSPLQQGPQSVEHPEKLETVAEVKTPDSEIPKPLNPKGPDKEAEQTSPADAGE